MKKGTLLLLFSIFFTAVQAQSTYDFFHQSDQKFYPARIMAVDRSNFPVLLIDSLMVEFWGDLQDVNTLFYSQNAKFGYDQDEKPITEHSRSINYSSGVEYISNVSAIYNYDQDNRRILYQTVTTDGFGNYLSEAKDEYSYTGIGFHNSIITRWIKNDPQENWKRQNRRITTGDDTFKEEQNEVWDENLTVFVPQSRTYSTYAPSGDPLSIQTELWTGTAFVVVSLTESTYDASGNILFSVSKSGSVTQPLQFSNKSEYTYDLMGRNTVTEQYTWDSAVSTWQLILQEDHTYNMQNEKVETSRFSPGLNGNPDRNDRLTYTYGPGIYTNTPEETLSQYLAPISMEYLDDFRNRNVFSDLPNGQVQLLIDNGQKKEPGVGEWLKGFYGELYYNKSQISSAPEVPTEKSCSVPNPYPSGFQVQCDQLKTDASYLLWVYDMNGKEVYAKHFKGGEGWSINRQLGSGTYFAVVTQNGRKVAGYKIVAGE